jgi:hypothetical protein
MNMRCFCFQSGILSLIFALALPASGSQSSKPEEILRTVADNGRKIYEALRGYSYYAELTLQTVSQADTITGEYYRFSQVSYDRDGNRQERVFEEKNKLPEYAYIGTNSANNLTRVYRFIITPETLTQYEFNYIGREKVDELNTFVFDVSPRVKLPDPAKSSERYLKGRVWIDDQDLQVVKVVGNAVPEQGDHRTPKFETYFQNHDEYWFPAFTSADDEVRVGRRVTRVMVKVRFTGYKKS